MTRLDANEEQEFDLALVTPMRFGSMLREAREEHRIPLEEMAQLSGGRFGVDELEIAEGGWRVYETGTIRELLSLYCVEASPSSERSQLRVERGRGVMYVGRKKKRFSPFANDQKVLVSYLAFMYGLRGAQLGTYAVLRAADLHELARVLDTSWLNVKRQLERLMVDGHHRVQRASRSVPRRFALPLAVAGLCLGAVAYQTQYRSTGARSAGASAPSAPSAYLSS